MPIAYVHLVNCKDAEVTFARPYSLSPEHVSRNMLETLSVFSCLFGSNFRTPTVPIDKIQQRTRPRMTTPASEYTEEYRGHKESRTCHSQTAH